MPHRKLNLVGTLNSICSSFASIFSSIYSSFCWHTFAQFTLPNCSMSKYYDLFRFFDNSATSDLTRAE